MRVALDARMIGHSGIGTAIRGWIEGWAQLPASERPEFVLLGDPPKLQAAADQLGASVISFNAPIYSLREQMAYPSAETLQSLEIVASTELRHWDLLHVPHYAHPLSYRQAMAVSVHDCFHLKYGSPMKRLYQKVMLRNLRRRSIPIMTGAAHVKEELVSCHHFSPERITVIPQGLPPRFLNGKGAATEDATRRALGLPAKYLLWVGIDQPHKNLARLWAALKSLYAGDKLDLPFVLAGLSVADAHKWQSMIFNEHLSGKILVISTFDERFKRALFAMAHAFIFPSLDEGFGFPPLEAMAYGVPCAISDTPALQHLCTQAALGFDPLKVEEIAQAISRISTDQALRATTREAGQRMAAGFDVVESARALIRWYERIVQSPRRAVCP